MGVLPVRSPMPRSVPFAKVQPVEPGAHRADDAPVEIVVPVPFQVFGRHARIVDHGPDDLPHGAGQGSAGVSDADDPGCRRGVSLWVSSPPRTAT